MRLLVDQCSSHTTPSIGAAAFGCFCIFLFCFLVISVGYCCVFISFVGFNLVVPLCLVFVGERNTKGIQMVSESSYLQKISEMEMILSLLLGQKSKLMSLGPLIYINYSFLYNLLT